MTRPGLGEGFLPNEFTRMGQILGYDLYSVNKDLPYEIGHAEHGDKVEMGECRRGKNNEIVYSIGANPCLIVVAITRARVPWVLHTMGDGFSLFQIETIQKSIGGIAGGGPEMITAYANLLEEHNITMPISHYPQADFNVAVVRKKIRDIPQGIHYGYGITKYSG